MAPSITIPAITSTAHVQRRTVVRRSLRLASLFVLAFPGVALAQAPGAATGGWVGPFTVIAAGLGMAIASGLCGLGQGRAIAAAVEAMGRQPGAAARIQTAMIIGLDARDRKSTRLNSSHSQISYAVFCLKKKKKKKELNREPNNKAKKRIIPTRSIRQRQYLDHTQAIDGKDLTKDSISISVEYICAIVEC